MKGFFYPDTVIHHHHQPGGPSLWVPRQGTQLTGWWGATQCLTFPFTGWSPYLSYGHHFGYRGRGPSIGCWSKVLQRYRLLQLNSTRLTTQFVYRQSYHRRGAPPAVAAQRRRAWLTTLATVLGNSRSRLPSITSWGSITSLYTNRSPRNRRLHKLNVVSLSRFGVFHRSTFIRGFNKVLVFPAISFRPQRRIITTAHRNSSRRRKWPQWLLQTGTGWADLHLGQQLSRVSSRLTVVGDRWRRRGPRYFKESPHIVTFPPVNFSRRCRVMFRGRHPRRGGRRRRWYPGPAWWAFRSQVTRPKVYLRRYGYLGGPLQNATTAVKPRWWRCQQLRYRLGATLVRRYRTPRLRRLRRPRRPGIWHLHRGSRGISHQQTWFDLPQPTGLLTKLASLTVKRGRRWSTERVWRRCGRNTYWAGLYLAVYTTVGTRSRRRSGTVIQVPSLLAPAKAAVLFRRWFAHGLQQHPARSWSIRVASLTTGPTTLLKQQHTFVTGALVNAALL